MLEYLALFFLIFASIVIFYAIIAIHDIPYEIAKKRNHPHLEAIHYAGWVSLFTLHVIWPFLWIWATLWHKENGWGNGNHQKEAQALASLADLSKQLPELQQQNLQLEQTHTKTLQELTALRAEFQQLAQRLAQLENKEDK